MPRRPIRREQALLTIDLPGQPLTCLIKRSSARRSLALRINADGQAQVNAPLAMPGWRIEAFVRRHQDWLRAQMAARPAGFAWSEGALLPYLGGHLRLVLRGDAGAVDLEGDCLFAPLADPDVAVPAWYRARSRAVLGERLDATCRRLGLALPAWRLSEARTRWGSLSAKGVVALNWRLIKASVAEIDYVICHELAHFRHRDHSPAYWREVARLCPDYAASRARLRAESAPYMAF